MILLMAGLAGFVNVNISTSCNNYNPDTRYEKIIVEKKIHSSAQIWSKVRVWPEKAWPETEIMRQMKKSYGQSRLEWEFNFFYSSWFLIALSFFIKFKSFYFDLMLSGSFRLPTEMDKHIKHVNNTKFVKNFEYHSSAKSI